MDGDGPHHVGELPGAAGRWFMDLYIDSSALTVV
jgi:hypothetical protein